MQKNAKHPDRSHVLNFNFGLIIHGFFSFVLIDMVILIPLRPLKN